MNTSGRPGHFNTQQPSGVTTFPTDVMTIRKPSQIPSSGSINQPIGIKYVDMSVHPSYFPSITPTTLPSYVLGDKPSYKSSINSLQDSTILPIFVPSIQDSDFPTHVLSV